MDATSASEKSIVESLLIVKPANVDCEDLAHLIRKDVNTLDAYFGDKQEFTDVHKLWKQKDKILSAICACLECDAGFFDSLAGLSICV